MSRHASAAQLSSYVDDELDTQSAEELIAHLEDCESCRARLDGMRRVVHRLHRLERAAPPPLLAQAVERRVRLAPREPSSLMERVESRLRAVPQNPSIFGTFAIIACLAGLVYFFSVGLERAQRSDTSLIVGKPAEVVAPTGEVQETRVLRGVTFEQVDGLWRQAGIEARGGDLRVDASEPEGQRVLELYPELPTLGDRVLVQVDELLVEIHGLRHLASQPGSASSD